MKSSFGVKSIINGVEKGLDIVDVEYNNHKELAHAIKESLAAIYSCSISIIQLTSLVALEKIK